MGGQRKGMEKDRLEQEMVKCALKKEEEVAR